MAVAEALDVGRRETVVETIAQALIRYIADNRLKPGDRLPSERQLVEMVDASRLPLREALCVLKGLGIIEAHHGKGIFVKPLDLTTIFGMLSPLLKTHADIDLERIFEARLHLEASIAELAASGRDEQNLESLVTSTESMRSYIRKKTVYVEHDMNFHQELARSTGNPIFVFVMASVTDLLKEVQHLYRDNVEVRESAIAEHSQILEAVRRGDGQKAREAMQRHLRNATKRL